MKTPFVKPIRPYSLPDYVEPDDNYITCAICGKKLKALNGHLQKMHGIECNEYIETYKRPIVSKNLSKLLSDKVKGDKNPAYQHGGRLSPFSKKFKKYEEMSEEQVQERIDELYENNSRMKIENPDTNPLRIEYYIARGMTEDEAKQALKDRQTTFSLEICIEKYGVEEGTKRWTERQELWHKNYKKSNFSKVSQKLFWAVINKLPNCNLDGIYFAQLHKETKVLDDSGINNELRMTLGDKVILPDFIDVKQKKIIEFDGAYWHQKRQEEGLVNPDLYKDELYEQHGYKVLRIAEFDFRDYPDEIIQQCVNFLIE